MPKFVKGRKVTAPNKTEVQYRRDLQSIVDIVDNALRLFVLPLFGVMPNGDVKEPSVMDIKIAFDSARRKVEQDREKTDDQIVLPWLLLLFATQKQRFNRMIQSSKAPEMSKLRANFIDTSSVFDLATVENQRLVASVPEAHIAQVESGVMAELSKINAESEKVVKEKIKKEKKKAGNRAKLIPMDQNEKVNGNLNKASQTQTGAIGYMWVNRGDDRVRGNPSGRYPNSQFNHWNRQGKFFLWVDVGDDMLAPVGTFNPIPPDGPPGVAVGCRCTAVPIWLTGEE